MAGRRRVVASVTAMMRAAGVGGGKTTAVTTRSANRIVLPPLLLVLLLSAAAAAASSDSSPPTPAGKAAAAAPQQQQPLVVVAPGGALRVGQAVISSTFSSGPVLHAFNVTAAADGWSVRVVHTSPSHVSITGSATDFSVSRDYLLAADGRVLINDTISARPGQGVVGVQVRHSLWSPELFIHGASGAGSSRYASSCATFGISGQLQASTGTLGYDAGTDGNPSVFAAFGESRRSPSSLGTTTAAASLGVGMVALDDVFIAHSETANRAGQLDAFSAKVGPATIATVALRSQSRPLGGGATSIVLVIYTFSCSALAGAV